MGEALFFAEIYPKIRRDRTCFTWEIAGFTSMQAFRPFLVSVIVWLSLSLWAFWPFMTFLFFNLLGMVSNLIAMASNLLFFKPCRIIVIMIYVFIARMLYKVRHVKIVQSQVATSSDALVTSSFLLLQVKRFPVKFSRKLPAPSSFLFLFHFTTWFWGLPSAAHSLARDGLWSWPLLLWRLWATLAPFEATRSKDATRLEAIATRVEAITTSSKKLLGAKGFATRSKDATRGSWPYY